MSCINNVAHRWAASAAGASKDANGPCMFPKTTVMLKKFRGVSRESRNFVLTCQRGYFQREKFRWPVPNLKLPPGGYEVAPVP